MKGSGVKRAGKGGHQRALRILNMRSMYNFGPDTILLDSSTVIIQKYFLHTISSFINLANLASCSSSRVLCTGSDTAQIRLKRHDL